MKEPLRVYVAGAYTPHNCSLHDASRIVQKNVDDAIKIGNKLMAKGHYVFIPHLSHYLHIHESCTVEDASWWYDLDNSFLDCWATALYYVGSSKGADAERDRAKKLGLTIFYSLSEVPDVIK